MALDGDGNVYAIWSKDSDDDGRPMVALTKYLADGTVALVAQIPGHRLQDRDVRRRPLGERRRGPSTSPARLSASTSSARPSSSRGRTTGTRRWAKLYDGPGRADAGFAAIAPCPDGGVYAVGDAKSDARDLLLVRYAANGTRTLTRRLGVGDGHDQWATDVAVDSRGRIAVCGGWRVSNKGYYVALLRRDGTVVWSHNYAGDKSYGWAKMLAIDASDRVCVTGNGRGAWLGVSAPSPVTFVAGPVATYAFSRAGTLRWSCKWPAGFDPAVGAPRPRRPTTSSSGSRRTSGSAVTPGSPPPRGADQFVIGWGL